MSVTLSGLARTVATAVIPGKAAGAHTIPGNLLASGSKLIAVTMVTPDFVTITDLTAQFSITGLNTIDNTGGTNSANKFLVVTYALPAAY